MKRISTRFALLMGAAAVLPLLAYGAVSIYSMRSTARAQVFQANGAVAQRTAEEIEQYVLNNVRILQGIAATLHETGLTLWQQERILKNSALRSPEFSELTLIDSQGSPVVTSRIGHPSVELPDEGSTPVGDVLISPFSIDDALLPTAIIAVPVTASGERHWLVGRVSLEALWQMVDAIRVGERGFALVVTRDGQLLAHGEPESKALVAIRPDMADHPLLEADEGGLNASSPGREYEDWSAERLGRPPRTLVGVQATMPTLGWHVLVEQPSEEAFAAPMRLQRQLTIVIVAALMVMLAVGYFFGRSFIVPILRLTRGTRALAEGRLGERVAVSSRDELGQLATAFNNMADRLVELQEDVIRKERQATFGRVAVGLVHDLSNPIQNIGNACKMIVLMFDDLTYRESFKRTIDRELAQVKRMLDDLRNIARPLPLQKVPIDVNRALGEVIESMESGAETSGLTLQGDLAPEPLYIIGDLFALNRVYRNLITNAFQATVAGGAVVVRSRRHEDRAVIEIADTGSGIPRERLETIFDDYVTTKKRGLGLGLAIAKRVVEQLDGTIGVTSEVGVGTTFTLTFPLTTQRPEGLSG